MNELMITCALVCAAAYPDAVAAQQIPREVTLGGHYGFDFTEGQVDHERIGVQGYVGLLGVLGVSATVSYVPRFFEVTDRYTGHGWQSFLTARAHPWGIGTPLSLGYGAAYSRTTIRDLRTGVSTSRNERTDAAVIAVEFSPHRFRPFAELYLLRLLDRSGQVEGNANFGVNVRLR